MGLLRYLAVSSLFIALLLSIYVNAFTLPYNEVSVLAVSGSGSKVYGVTASIRVRVSRGSGRIFYSLSALADKDFQTSVILSTMLGALIIGSNYLSNDYFIELSPHLELVSGPSAGAAISALIAASLVGVKLNRSIAITGVVLPDSTIGPVGALPEKIQAACRAGIKVVIIPKGQVIARKAKSNKTVNLREISRKCGIRLIEVSNLEELFSVLGIKQRTLVKRVNLSINSYPNFRNLIMTWIRSFNSSLAKLREDIRERVGRINDLSLRNLVTNLSIKADKLYQRSLRELAQGSPYSAVSDMFAALIDLSTAYWLIEARTRGREGLDELLLNIEYVLNNASDMVNKLIIRFNESKEFSIDELSIVVEVVKRFHEAEREFKRFKDRLSRVDIDNLSSLYNLVYEGAYILWRGNSIVRWCEVLNVVGKESYAKVDSEAVSKIARVLTYYTKVSLEYLKAILSPQHSDYLTEIENLLNDAFKYLSNNTVRTLAIDMLAIAEISSYLSAVLSKNVTERALMLKNMSLTLAEKAVTVGFKPLITLTYIERGNSFLKLNPYYSIYFYDLAITNTMWYLMMLNFKALRGISPLHAAEVSNVLTFALGLAVGVTITLLVIVVRRRIP